MVADEQDVDKVRVCAVFGKESREHDKVVELEPSKVVRLDEPNFVDGEDYTMTLHSLFENYKLTCIQQRRSSNTTYNRMGGGG